MNNTKVILLSLIAPIWLALAGSAAAADVICYNCPPEWADWASMLRAIKADLGYDIPFDNKNSGQALSQLIAEKNNPVADLAYYGVNFGMKAKAAGVKRTLIGLEMLERGIARDGYKVQDLPGNEIGYVTSGSYAPFLKKNIALAYVPPEHSTVDSDLAVEIRGQAVKARVIPTPFYKRPKKTQTS